MLEKGNTELGIPQITYKKVGRKTKKDDATVNKLYSAFAIGASVEDACAYARISKQTFYDWCKNDQQFSDDMNDIRNNPILKAYDTMYKNLDDPKYALEVLKRRRRKDWAERIEQTGAGGKDLSPIIYYPGQTDNATSPDNERGGQGNDDGAESGVGQEGREDVETTA